MEMTPSETRALELSNWRVEVIRSLRALADLLATTSRAAFPTPDIYCSVYSIDEPTDENPHASRTLDVEDARIAMANAPGNWRKYNYEGSLAYIKDVGDPIRVRLEVDRSRTCTRVQVGTKTVEAVEAHEEPVYEWRCDTPELEV